MSLISIKLRNSARGQSCAFQIPGICNGDPETVVLCHAPSEVKGAGNKSPDFWAAHGCHACHEHLDQHRLPRVDEQFFWLRGIFRTWQRWVDRGLVILPVDPATAKKRPKKKTYWPSRELRSANTLRKRKPNEAGG
jgi:hypothetical protein